MAGARKKIITSGIIAAGLLIVLSVFFAFSTPSKTHFREALADAFNRPVDLIELNLPPADGRYPGAVMLSPREGQILPLRKQHRPSEIPTSSTSLRLALDDTANASLAAKLIGKTQSTGALDIEVTLDELRLFETDINRQLKNDLLNDADVYRAEKQGLSPTAIVRTYEAIVTLSFGKTSSLSGEAWRQFQKNLIDAGGKAQRSGRMTFSSPNPTVLAYEALSVNYIATNLSGGSPDRVELKQVLAPTASPEEQIDLSAFNLQPSDITASFATLGNDQFQSRNFGDLNVIGPSLELASEVLNQVGAQSSLEASPTTLNQSEFESRLDRIADRLTEERPDLFILYYAGHAVSGNGGQSYLVMRDYNGSLPDDLGQDLMLGLSRAQTEAPSSPLGGSNIGSLLDAVTAIQGTYTKEIQGLYPVSKIAQRLEATNVPFILLIDGCFQHHQMVNLRDALNLTESGDYYGPNNAAIESQELYQEALHQFGLAPYLRSNNAVVFSAAPGTLALAVEDPRPQPLLHSSQEVAPLARRMHNSLTYSIAHSNPVTWGDFIRSIVDVRPSGEPRAKGTASWSVFSGLDALPMLEKLSRETN